MEKEEFSIRHTGEHLLIGSLVRRIPSARVVRVVHEDDVDKAFLESKSSIDWEDVIYAAIEANQRVKEGHRVSIEFFDSLEEARKKYPSLRAYDERLEGKDRIRVVNIGGFDFSACKNPHVEDTSLIGLILPLRVSSVRKGLYEIVFISGSKAIERALRDTDMIYRVARILGCNRKDVLKRVRNVVDELSRCEELKREYTKFVIYNHPVERDGFSYLLVALKYIDLNYVMSIASSIMRERSIDILCVISWDGERYSIFLASKDIDIEDFKSRIREVAGGRGGGRLGMYMGYIENVDAFIKFFKDYFG